MQGDVEVSKRTHDAKSSIYKEELESRAQMKHFRKEAQNDENKLKEIERNKNKD